MSDRIILNVNFTKDPNAFRSLEIFDFHSQNFSSNFSSPIDNTITRVTNNKINLYVVKKRLINLMDTWNRFLNSGLFVLPALPQSYGSNINHSLTEWLFKTQTTTFNFSTETIFNKLVLLLEAISKSINYYLVNGSTYNNNAYFQNVSSEFYGFTRDNFDFLTIESKALISEFIVCLKDLIDETKLYNLTNYMFADIDVNNEQWVTNFITLKPLIYNNYKLIKRVYPDGQYPSDRSKDTDIQFCIELNKYTDTNNPWLVKNILIDTTGNTLEKKKSKIGCTILQMTTPIVAKDVINIDWSDSMDKPYIMLYNGATKIFIPDEIKNNEMIPDNLYNLSAKFWSVGTADINDLNYNISDDIKLKLYHPLIELRKLSYFDNLTLLLKLDPY